MDFEKPLTGLIFMTSIISIGTTYLASYFLLKGNPAIDPSIWWKLSSIITCGTAAGAIIPEFTKIFTSTNSRHVREIVDASREGGASLNILSGLTAGNFSAFWMGGVAIAGLMAVAYGVAAAAAPPASRHCSTPARVRQSPSSPLVLSPSDSWEWGP